MPGEAIGNLAPPDDQRLTYVPDYSEVERTDESSTQLHLPRKDLSKCRLDWQTGKRGNEEPRKVGAHSIS